MKIENNIARDVEIAYIGGGSRGWAWTLMNDLTTCPDMNGRVALYDIDYPAAQDNAIIGQRYAAHPDASSLEWPSKKQPKTGK